MEQSFLIEYLQMIQFMSQVKQGLQQNKRSYFSHTRLHKLRESFPLRNQANKSQTKEHFLNLSKENKEIKSSEKLISLENRNLHYLFHQFCKQSYIGGSGATFDDIAKSAEIMTLNKWMTFCNQFKLTEKITYSGAASIYKTATNEGSQMNIEEFCQALKIFQQRTKLSENYLGKNMLQVDSHSSARNRLCEMKINFSGPKVNYFIQSRLTQKQRIEEKLALTKKKLTKQVGVILHQGMFKQHIEMSLLQRKIKRQQRTECLRNRSAVYETSQLEQMRRKSILTNNIQYSSKKSLAPLKKQRKIKNIFGNYSNIFRTKIINNSNFKNPQGINQMTGISKYKNRSTTSTQAQSTLKYQSQQAASPIKQKQIVLIEYVKFEQLPFIDSDTESDEILKSHYENEQKRKMEKNLASIPSQIDNEDSDLMITGYE